jgi:type IV pilus assembly protein PilV
MNHNAAMHSRTLPLPAARAQRGMTMIELLIAVLIFSFSMLGLAGLQTRTLALNQSGLYRSQATALTADVLDQMRSSIVKARAKKWDTALTTAAADVSVSNGGIADTELQAWKARVEKELPAGKASITTADSAKGVSSLVTIEIQWDDSRGREGAQSFKTITRL